MDLQEFQKAWGKVVTRAWSDELFKKRLLADPKTVLKENGIEVPAEVNVKVMEDSGKTVHLILPAAPAELSAEELDKVAGGIAMMQPIWPSRITITSGIGKIAPDCASRL
jgi:hypothetical protein